MPVRELAPAKINLTLKVRGRRPDGYHELESLVTFADVHDVVTLGSGEDGSVTVAGPFAHHLSGENLLVRALALLRAADAKLRLGSVRLDKNLPVAAGLGGGSADAAALLRAVRQANPDRAEKVPWLDIAVRLGADVTVCFGGRPALMHGIGERTVPVARLAQAHAVLVNSGAPLATPDVFEALAAGPAPPAGAPPIPPDLSRPDLLVAYMRAQGNDLERAATRLLPAIGEVRAGLEAVPECRLAAMAGSGPTCFGIFANEAQARRAAGRIAGAHGHWWVKPTVLRGSPAV